MTDADTGIALLRAILDNPADDDRRLVYADWLEEHGEQPLRAEFIRAQCRLPHAEGNEGCWLDWPANKRAGAHGPDAAYCERCRLAHREGELNDHLVSFVEDLPGTFCGGGRNLIIKYGPGGIGIHYTFQRGFVAEVSCKAQHWLDYAGQIMASHPVTRVTLTDKKPVRGGNRGEDDYFWECDDPHLSFLWDESPSSWHAVLSKQLYALLPSPHPVSFLSSSEYEKRWSRYRQDDWRWIEPSEWVVRGRQTALDALSTACTLYGQQKAVFPSPLQYQ